MRWLVAALLVAAAVAGALVVRSSREPDAAPVAQLAPGATTGEQLAAAACVRLRLVQQGIAADSAADTVRRELADARALAAAAVDKDGRYASLSGGAAALDDALRHDDPSAAVVAVRVVHASCG